MNQAVKGRGGLKAVRGRGGAVLAASPGERGSVGYSPYRPGLTMVGTPYPPIREKS